MVSARSSLLELLKMALSPSEKGKLFFGRRLPAPRGDDPLGEDDRPVDLLQQHVRPLVYHGEDFLPRQGSFVGEPPQPEYFGHAAGKQVTDSDLNPTTGAILA